jgi:hypothetical protein
MPEEQAPNRSPSPVQRASAALFLLALVGVPVVVALLWGRTGARRRVAPTDSPLSLSPVLPEGESLALGPEDREFLSKLFLQTLRDPKAPAKDKVVPANCRRILRPVVFASLYAPGRRRLRVRAREYTLAASVQGAARDMSEEAEYSNRGFLRSGDLSLRIDVILREVPLSVPRRRQLAALDLSKPVGVALAGEEDRTVFLPSDLAEHRALDHEDMLQAVCRKRKLSPHAWTKDTHAVSMLWTESFLHLPSGEGEERTMPLVRGLPLVKEVSPSEATRAGRLAAEFLVKMGHAGGGTFPVSYNATTGTASADAPVTARARATAALARHAADREEEPRGRLLEAARAPLAGLVREVRALPGNESIAFVATGKNQEKAPSVEATAVVLQAFCAWRAAADQKDWDELIGRLTNFLLLVQKENGRFPRMNTSAGIEGKTSSEEKGEMRPPDARRQAVAAWALAAAFAERQDPAALLGAQRALETLKNQPAALDSPVVGRPLARAVLALSPHLPVSRYLPMVRRSLQPLFARQLGAEDAPAPDLAGGALGRMPPSVAETAADLEAFVAGRQLALQVPGKQEPYFADRCRRAAQQAARFVVPFQFRPTNSYYVLDPAAALGGFRRRPGSNLVPLQTVQNALEGLDLFATTFTQTEDKDDDSQGPN